MDKRTILAIAISIAVLVIYQEWVSRYYGVPPTPSPTKKEIEKPIKPAPHRTTQNSAVPIPLAPLPNGPRATDVTVNTDNFIAVFTTRGARLKSFKFKNYRSAVDENSPPFEMVPAAAGVPLPLGLRWQEATGVDDSGLLYGVEGGDLKLAGDQKGKISFRGQTPGGTVVTKSLTFSGATYPIQLDTSVITADGKSIVPEVMLTAENDHSKKNPGAPFEGLVALVDNKIKREKVSEEMKKGQEFSGDIAWAGFGYTYFLMALLPDHDSGHRLWIQESGPALVLKVSGQAGNPTLSSGYTLFIGPKELNTLKSLDKGLERAIDFGYFSFVSMPLLYVLHFSHRFTGSYGVDIILLTFLIKVLMAPLTHKSFVSMKRMQKLQPQMERLKEKFAKDKEKLNKEIMELYRRNGVNPLGGCLPMLLQFPVFIGLYNALSTPIELRHAPFMWIKDLSRPDWESIPFTLGDWHLGIPILTVLMGASMFLQQWLTPSAGDPNQRKMMLMMPLLFTFMFVSFPAGLTVYWLVNNILSIGQQYWINRSDR